MKKIKKVMSIAASICLSIACLMACDSTETPSTNESTVVSESDHETESIEETKPYFEETREDIEVEVPNEVDAMRPILAGLCKAMTGGGYYDPSDSQFYWEALYSSINGNTWVHPEISLDDSGSGYMVPVYVMEEYAAAMFADASDLPEIPSTMGGIEYIEDQDSYLLYSAGGFVGNMNIVAIDSVDNGYKVSVAFNTKNGNVEDYVFDVLNEGTESFPCAVRGIIE